MRYFQARSCQKNKLAEAPQNMGKEIFTFITSTDNKTTIERKA